MTGKAGSLDGLLTKRSEVWLCYKNTEATGASQARKVNWTLTPEKGGGTAEGNETPSSLPKSSWGKNRDLGGLVSCRTSGGVQKGQAGCGPMGRSDLGQIRKTVPRNRGETQPKFGSWGEG